MLLVAKMKGWSGIHLTGSDQFKEKAFLTAVLSGHFTPAQITGYDPSERALVILAMAGKLPVSHKQKDLKEDVDEPGTKSANKIRL